MSTPSTIFMGLAMMSPLVMLVCTGVVAVETSAAEKRWWGRWAIATAAFCEVCIIAMAVFA
jgi:hypothetical protein